ncbi:MAG: Structural maintenance of chromosomes protein 5 [Thelocarpon impressellum]|nr:MAG: Structural maintenance of chromosomes protein 5 [Thelocarpon impressellum]
MPAIPLRRRRAVVSDDEDDDGSGYTSARATPTPASEDPLSSSRKRARYGSDDGASPALGASRALDQPGAVGEDEEDEERYQPGSIVRVKLDDFVTYTSAEFFPGPSLNMVIGPNGTGKSTLVCAICLGLGWGPQHLGRAKDVSEYVKHGCHEASIEIELAGRPGEANPVIRRQIKREGNKSSFFVDDKPVTLKAVLELAKSFSIQIDNLCQFLPQDKVCEFAALTPVELLQSTQRAAAGPLMLQWHDILKQLRGEQKKVQAQQDSDKEHLANLDGRQQMLRGDVERLREREGIQERVKMLEAMRPLPRYREARAAHAAARNRKREAQTALKRLEDEVEPSLRAVNAKQTYRGQIVKGAVERTRAVERAELAADDMLKALREKEDGIAELHREIQVERDGDKVRRRDVVRLKEKIQTLERQMHEAPVDFNPASYNERIREKQRAERELQMAFVQLRDTRTQLEAQGRDKARRIGQAEKELEELDSRAGQQAVKLRGVSRETAHAWEWIREHQDAFEHQVFGPPIVECSVKDARYVDAVESLMGRNELTSFTVQSRADYNKLSAQLYGTMKLAEINIRTSTDGLRRYRAPVPEEEMRRLGFEGWALDYVDGPEPVLAMLCDAGGLHKTAVALRDLSNQHYEAVQASEISNYVAGKSSYHLTWRREYGQGGKSTTVRDVRRGQIWTDQPVDMSAKNDLKENIRGWGEERDELKRQYDEATGAMEARRKEVATHVAERKELEEEKGAKQKAHSEFGVLPTRLGQLQEKLTSAQRGGAELNVRLLAIVGKLDAQTLEMARIGRDYATHVETMEGVHEELVEAELMQIEASSDLEALISRNRAVKETLEARRAEVKVLAQQREIAIKEVRALFEECQAIMAGPDADRQKEFMDTMSREMSSAELELEIESERARLELVHEGNPNAMAEYEEREKHIARLQERIQKVEEMLVGLEASIEEIRERWEPELDGLVRSISDAFAECLESIGCAGAVGVFKDGADFDAWALQILVKFREHEPLTQLTAHRQSGGERAVSTIFYLLALQSLARAPFRVVDEINQGMDPRNERVVHERMLDMACGDGGDGARRSQYFLITPKLLRGLRYHRRMRVLCIASGEYMLKPEADGEDGWGEIGRLDFAECARRKGALAGIAVGA